MLSLGTGSACNAGALEPSYVLEAIGLDRDSANRTIRVGLGRFSTEMDMVEAREALVKAYYKLEKSN